MKGSDASSVVSSENIAPDSVTSSMDLPLSPTSTSLQSIWSSSTSNLANAQVRQSQFSKSGPQRLPIRNVNVASPLHGAAADIIE